jgi:signal transduction histidine kinase
MALTFFFIAVVVALFVSRGMNWWGQLELQEAIDKVEAGLRVDAAGVPQEIVLRPELGILYSALSKDMMYRVLDTDGHVLFSSNLPATALSPEGQPFSSDLRTFKLNREGVPLDAALRRFDRFGTAHYIQVARSERLRMAGNQMIGAWISRFGVYCAIISLLVFVLTVSQTFRRVLKTIHGVSAAATQIDPRNLSTRLEPQGLPTDLHPLIEAFNAALARLEHGYRVQQDFLASAAHELKTPLALIRGQIELNGVADRATLLKDVDFMARQVQQLLQLAEASELQNYVVEPVEVVAVAFEAAGFLGQLAERNHVLVTVQETKQPVFINADRGALYILIKNLLENAIRHTPLGSSVVVEITSEHLLVRDNGRGVSPELVPKLFTRFWRAGGNQEGAGLGLSICREISQALGWELTAKNIDPGMEFVVSFGREIGDAVARVAGDGRSV